HSHERQRRLHRAGAALTPRRPCAPCRRAPYRPSSPSTRSPVHAPRCILAGRAASGIDMTHDHDLLLRFLLPTAGVRGVAVRLEATWQAMAARASYPRAVAELLGEAAAAAAPFPGPAEGARRLPVQLRSPGALRTLFAACTAA